MDIVGKRVAYITLGCKLNFSETSTIKHSLEQEGAVSVSEKDEADIFVINTCSVTDIAEKKGRQMIRKIVHRNPDACIVVVGCYAQLRAQEIQSIEGVSLVLGIQDKFQVVQHLKSLQKQESYAAPSCNALDVNNFDIAYSFGDRTRCFLKIQDGCNYFCSYCTIPFARGNSRSATIQSVIDAVRDVAAKGIKEIILTGVNTGDFGRGTQETFFDLIQRLDEMQEIQRFRISSIEPNLLTDDIIRFVASSQHFMPHFHIPLQSGNNEVLKLMKRRYKREVFAEKVMEIKTLIPDAFIGVDVIAGMRGETPEAFEDARQFIADLNVSQLHVFPYSERSGTKALEIPYVVPQAEKHHRVDLLLDISNQKLHDFYMAHVGQIRPVLFEESNVSGVISGFTDNYIRVKMPYHISLANQIVPVELKTDIFDL